MIALGQNSQAIAAPLRISGAWLVLKFGGTSVATAERWGSIEKIIRSQRATGMRVLVVCSALAGVTNRLEALVADIDRGAPADAALGTLAETHAALAGALGVDVDRVLGTELAALKRRVAELAARGRSVTPPERALLMAYGELMSSRLGAEWLERRLGDVAWLDAREVLRGLDKGERAERYLSARCAATFDADARRRLDALGVPVVVTQGFIARGPEGETVLLGRGGSDAAAAYLGAAVGASAVELWSDVPGMFTADPRAVAGARLLQRVSYDEAETFGALGAKVLHPRAVEPARAAGIPIRLGWTAQPDVVGTRILGSRQPRGAKAVVSRRQLALVTMWRRSSWQPVGFMADVASRFHARGLSMDLIASSPSEIRVTVDLAAFPSAASELDALLGELSQVCRPRVTQRVACVSVAGAGVAHALGRTARGAALFSEVPTYLVSHAPSGGHISVIVDDCEAPSLVASLHDKLIAPRRDEATFGPSWSALGGTVAMRVPSGPATASSQVEVQP
ncbi:MAG: aspartate kinase [Deltaproteobacteria bacterium]|nr:aspartate kinase [Deltaproteobacteria bacterium]